MAKFLSRLSLVFAAGCVGAVVNSLGVWAFGHYGISAALGVNIAPDLTPGWLYPRIVRGGLWGALFLLPVLKRSVLGRGLVLSLGPSLVRLFVIFPYHAHKGPLGLALGTFTPVLVLFFNALWGVTAALWMRLET
jgi:hypothetical protein